MGELFSFYLAPDRKHSSFNTAALWSENIQLVEIIHDMLSKRCVGSKSDQRATLEPRCILVCDVPLHFHNYARLDTILSSLMSTAAMSQYAW